MHPRPLSWVCAKAAPQKARERQEGTSAEPKLAVDTVGNRAKTLLLLFNTTRMVPGPPSTGVAIAMDGGMADTACYYTGR